MKGSVRDFPPCLQAAPGLIMGVEFTAQRKGVSSGAGPEQGWRWECDLLHLCTQERDASRSSRRGRGRGVARARRGWSPECTGAAPEAAVGGWVSGCVCVCVCVCVCARARACSVLLASGAV